jgi:hypothetical protein
VEYDGSPAPRLCGHRCSLPPSAAAANPNCAPAIEVVAPGHRPSGLQASTPGRTIGEQRYSSAATVEREKEGGDAG